MHHFVSGRFYRGSRHFEVKAWWSRSEIEEKFMPSNSQSEAPLELADTKPIQGIMVESRNPG